MLRRRRAGQHAAPGDELRDSARRSASSAAAAAVASAAGGVAVGHGRRLPRRRRQLEGDRVLDRAIVERLLLLSTLQQLERQQPRALAASRPRRDRDVERRAQLLRPLRASARSAACARRASASASSRAPASSNPVTDARSSRACVGPACRSRARSASSCGALAAVSLPVERDVAARRGLRRARGRHRPLLPGGAERSNCTTYCSASWSNAARSFARCSRSNSASQASGDGLASWSSCTPCSSSVARGLRLAARVQQRGVLEHRAQARVGLRDLDRRAAHGRPFDEARAGHGDVGRRAPSAAARRRAAPCACTATSRADTGVRAPAPAAPAWRSGLGASGFLAGGLEKRAIEVGRLCRWNATSADYVPHGHARLQGDAPAPDAQRPADAGRRAVPLRRGARRGGPATRRSAAGSRAAKSQLSSLSITALT